MHSAKNKKKHRLLPEDIGLLQAIQSGDEPLSRLDDMNIDRAISTLFLAREVQALALVAHATGSQGAAMVLQSVHIELLKETLALGVKKAQLLRRKLRSN